MKYKLNKLYSIILGTLAYIGVSADPALPASYWVPTFSDNKTILGWLVKASTSNSHWIIVKWIAEWIKYVWLLAVISLIIGWFMYITTLWDDSKAKKAKNIIIYSIAWVIVAMAAYSVIDIVNNLKLL